MRGEGAGAGCCCCCMSMSKAVFLLYVYIVIWTSKELWGAGSKCWVKRLWRAPMLCSLQPCAASHLPSIAGYLNQPLKSRNVRRTAMDAAGCGSRLSKKSRSKCSECAAKSSLNEWFGSVTEVRKGHSLRAVVARAVGLDQSIKAKIS